MKQRIGVGFYQRDTLEVARDLLGRVLCRRLPDGSVLRGRLVEVEAYDGPSDRACHAWRGMTRRNAPLFGSGGLAYVYLVYGMHNLLNVVTGPKDYPAAVLLRAAESPAEGVSASGPGRLTRAFRVDRALDRASFAGPELWLESGDPVQDSEAGRTPRIGVDYAGSWARRRFRFVIRNHPDLSGPATLNRRAR